MDAFLARTQADYDAITDFFERHCIKEKARPTDPAEASCRRHKLHAVINGPFITWDMSCRVLSA